MQAAGPGRAIWTAWGLALLGGLAVLAASVIALSDPCTAGGQPPPSEACTAGVPLTLVQTLTGVGTALAVVGGLTATYLTLRRFSSGGTSLTAVPDQRS